MVNNLDYVELYVKKLKENPLIFNQQKRLIEAQMKGSSSLFKAIKGDDFKKNARVYLKKIGLI